MFTVEMLDKFNPCATGRAAALPFLPAKLSTYPEKNIELALELAQSESVNTAWLKNSIVVSPNGDSDVDICCDVCDPDYHYDSGGRDLRRSSSGDPFLIAQYLAWVADSIATRDGR